jgi:hypothetical protein
MIEPLSYYLKFRRGGEDWAPTSFPEPCSS